MRKLLLSLTAAGAVLAAASPAAAQYYPQPQPAPYGYHNRDNDFRGGWGQVRELRERIYRVRQQIIRLDHRDALGRRTADRLVHEANEIDRRQADKSRGGLDQREAGQIQYRLQRLEQQVQFALADHHPRWDNRY
jgi:Spy/CpxP family protein refolding chaperone